MSTMMTMTQAYAVADRYLQGFHTTDDEVRGAFRKLQTSTNAAAPSYLSRMEQRMDTAIREGVTPAKPGRPAIGDQIKIAFPPDLLASIDTAADEAGISRSEWIRRACRAALPPQQR